MQGLLLELGAGFGKGFRGFEPEVRDYAPDSK